MAEETEVNAVAELVLKADKNVPAGVIEDGDHRSFLITRNDVKVQEITPAGKATIYKPQAVTQAVQVQDVDSFIHYTNRMMNEDSMIFADIANSVVHGVIDYHQMPEANHGGASTLAAGRAPVADHTEHTVTLNLPFSIEWMTWTRANNKLMTHKDFATFLEENAQDIMPLPKRVGLATSEQDADMPETLIELTRSLQVTNKVDFASVVRHGDYERIEFSKQSDATAKGTIGLPVSFEIVIPVYFGEASVSLRCFTRKKVEDGILSIGFSINRAENVRQDEFKRIVSNIAGSTELTTLFGKPSAS